jgi:hypothetical protein
MAKRDPVQPSGRTLDLQHELPLSSVMAHELFPGRAVLMVKEVAHALRCTQQHVINLIEDRKIKAVDLAGAPISLGGTNKTDRRFYRIPVSAYDDFIRKNQS